MNSFKKRLGLIAIIVIVVIVALVASHFLRDGGNVSSTQGGIPAESEEGPNGLPTPQL